jgi:hypothetical protein
MTDTTWLHHRGVQAALTTLLLAAALAGWTVHRALHPAAPDEVPPGAPMMADALDTVSLPPAVDVAAAFAADLFSPDRSAPATRYRMPGEPSAVTSPATAPVHPIVLGTATSVDGTRFATCQYQSDRLLMVRVGDRIADYTVKSIDRGRVVFNGPGGSSFEVVAPKPGS